MNSHKLESNLCLIVLSYCLIVAQWIEGGISKHQAPFFRAGLPDHMTEGIIAICSEAVTLSLTWIFQDI